MDKIIKLVKSININKGYTENIYQEAICVLLRENNIKYSKESILPVYFNKICIGNVRADIILEELKIVLECKAITNNLSDFHFPQIINYMQILNYDKGLFINFNQSPIKDLIEIYKVSVETDNSDKTNNSVETEDNLRIYKFEHVSDIKSNSIYLNENGIKIEINNIQDEIEWVNENIIKCDNNFLSKKDCFEKSKFNSKHFIECIEKHTVSLFCDKQIKNIKHKQIILNWKIKD